MSPTNLSRRMMLRGAAALPAITVPALLPSEAAAAPAIDSREAMVARAEQLVQLLGGCYIREGWKLDVERAAQFVESVRAFDGNDGECPKFVMVLDWMHDHGQSLDWLATGDIGGMITTQAALRAKVSVIPDPIIAAIADHRRLYRQWSSFYNQLEEAEEKVMKAEPRPFPLIAWRDYSAIGHSEIERARDEFLAKPGADRKKIEREYKKAKADERAARQAERDWYKRHGLAGLKSETGRASKAERNAQMMLTKIRPTTVAGVGALVSYVRSDMRIGECEWQIPALANAARALMAMPNAALPPFSPESKDIDLMNATSAMQDADRAIDRLHKRYGDDADGRDDYLQIEGERFERLDVLATKRARTEHGIVAKAAALSERRLIEDYARHGKIATSLAHDVLRYFGRVA